MAGKKKDFGQVVQEDSEFSDEGDQGHFGWFIALTQLLVKAAQDWICADGANGGHIQGTAQPGSAAGDMAAAFTRSACSSYPNGMRRIQLHSDCKAVLGCLRSHRCR